MKYYIVDTTLSPAKERLFDSYPQVLGYLEQMVVREANQSRKQRMLMLEELGHGEDDIDGVNFTRHMSEKYNIGVIREAGGKSEKMRCDVTTIAKFQQDEFGD
jgi:hypothetical protein